MTKMTFFLRRDDDENDVISVNLHLHFVGE